MVKGISLRENYECARSRADDRWSRFSVAGGKSGLHRAGCWVTPSLGDEEESATESKPPPALARGVRVKR